ncbi:MAG: hypothetical protein RR782_06925 [Clostridium sp.]
MSIREELHKLLIPKELNIFKATCIKGIFILQEDEPDIKGPVNIVVFTEVIDYKLVDRIDMESNEGTVSKGVVVLVKLQIYEIIEYEMDLNEKKTYSTINSKINYIYLIIDNEINGVDTKVLIKKNQLIIDSYVEVVESVMLDIRAFYRYISIIIYLKNI